MTFEEFSLAARKFAIYPGAQTGGKDALSYLALGLNGEAGEVADKLKKLLRDHPGRGFSLGFHDGMVKELGDVLWYVSIMADELGSSLDAIAKMNLHKLRSRHTRGVLGGSGDDR